MQKREKINVLDNLVAQQIVANLRDEKTDPRIFRDELRKLGFIMGYEIAEELESTEASVKTVLGSAQYQKVKDRVVIINVLRAATLFVQGFLEAYPDAEVGILSASRVHENDEFRVNIEYDKVFDLTGSTVLVADPMLATGTTLNGVLNYFNSNGQPEKIIVCSAIAAKPGVEYLVEKHPNIILYTSALDEKLDENGYIVPGLGDAGARAFSTDH